LDTQKGKPKRKGLPKAPKPPFQPLHADQETSSRISMVQERLIGRIVSRWSKLEALMNDLIWNITNLNIEDGRLLTERQDATRLIIILRALGGRYLTDKGTPSPRSRFFDTLDKIDQLREDRNQVAHGSWGEFDSVPIVLSLRVKSDELFKIAGETYLRQRMNKIADDIAGCTQIMN
jgi:hypothetical protein